MEWTDATRPRCFASPPGTVNRSSTVIKWPPTGWLSTILAHTVLEIVLREFLGFSLHQVKDTADTVYWASAIGTGEYDLEVEIWAADPETPGYKQYVTQDRLVEVLNPIGYPGRSGLFITKPLAEEKPLAAFYKFWKDSANFPASNVTRFSDFDLRAWLGDRFPICDKTWCSTGELAGHWAPQRCRADPYHCAALLHPTPYYDEGYFEQLVANHNLSVVLTYTGFNVAGVLAQLAAAGKQSLFYWWEPDPLLSKVSAERVSFPDFQFGCLSGNTREPSGSVRCDYREQMLPKAVRRALRWEAPEAYYALARLQLQQEDMRELLSSTVEGGGSMDTFQAACAFVKAREATLIADMAPACISRPPARPVTGDLVFDPALIACRAVTAFPEERSSSTCLAQPLRTPGTPAAEGPDSGDRNDHRPDHSRTKVKLARAGPQRVSHELVSSVLEILLKEYLGYDLWLVNTTSFPAEDWGRQMDTGAYDADIEVWHAGHGLPVYAEYVSERELVLNPGTIGYGGRSSIFVLPHTMGKSDYADYWRFYANNAEAGQNLNSNSDLDFLTFADVDLRGLLGEDFPACAQAAHPWCGGPGTAWEGWYIPSVCQGDPSGCLVVFAAAPELDADTGYFEQLTGNLALPLVYAYLGAGRLQQFVRAVAAEGTRDLLFRGVEPDPFPASVYAVRVSFPDHFFGCDSGDTRDPRSGTVLCDSASTPLEKLLHTRLTREAPEAAYVVEHLTFTTQDLQGMLRQHRQAGGTRDSGSIACDWVRGNLPQLRQSAVPDCVAFPKQLKDVQAGDRIFDPVDRVCEPVTCPPQEILVVLRDTIVCQACGEGLLPDAKQTRCIVCPPFSAPVAMDSGQLQCRCEAGTRQVQVVKPGLGAGPSPDPGPGVGVGTAWACKPCPQGTFANESQTHPGGCQNCTVGSFAASPGSTACSPCPAGSASAEEGAPSCPRCGLASFQELSGATACSHCAAHMITPFMGAESQAQCGCKEGYFREGPGEECRPCLEGMVCPSGSDLSAFHAWQEAGRHVQPPPAFPLAQVGYMSLAGNPLSMYLCSGPEKCPGGPPGTCGQGLSSSVVACNQCPEGLFWTGKECAACAPVAKWLFPLVPLLMGPLVVVLLYLISRDDSDSWGNWRNCMASLGLLLLNCFQTTSIVLRANLSITGYLSNWADVLANSENPTYLFRPQCAGITTFRDDILARTLVPFILLIMVLLTYSASHVLGRLCGHRWMAMNSDRSANVYFSLIFTFFAGLSSTSLTAFMCAHNPNGKSTLIVDRSIHCYEGEWNGVVAISIVAIAYILFFGAVFLRTTIIAPRCFSKQAFRQRWKFLFIKFSPDVWWWALCFCAKGVLANAGFVFIQSGTLQIYWVMLVIAVYLIAQLLFTPWRHIPANTMDVFSCVAIIVLISLVAFVHASTEVVDDLKDLVHGFIAAVVIAPSLAGGVLLLSALRSQRMRSSKESEIRTHYRLLARFRALPEDLVVQLLDMMDDWGRYHIMRALRIIRVEAGSLAARASIVGDGQGQVVEERLTDGRISQTICEQQQKAAATATGTARDSHWSTTTGTAHRDSNRDTHRGSQLTHLTAGSAWATATETTETQRRMEAAQTATAPGTARGTATGTATGTADAAADADGDTDLHMDNNVDAAADRDVAAQNKRQKHIVYL